VKQHASLVTLECAGSVSGAAMRRWDFGRALLGATAGASLRAVRLSGEEPRQAEGAERPHRKNTRMHVNGDYHVVEGKEFISKENIGYNLRCGATHINPDPVLIAAHSGPPKAAPKSGWGDFISSESPQAGAFDLDALKRMRDLCDSMGMTIEGFRMDSGYIVM